MLAQAIRSQILSTTLRRADPLRNTGTVQVQRRVVSMKSKEQTLQEWQTCVNMSKEELQSWLESPDSFACGQHKQGEAESTGRQSGHKIVEMLDKDPAEWDEDDLSQARRVVSYVKRHEAQKPSHDAEQLEHMKWTYSLRNWGHDPLKDEDVQ